VGEVERPNPVCPSRALRTDPVVRRVAAPYRTLVGLEAPFETFASQRSRYLVHGSRLVVGSTTRSFADSPADAEAPAASMGFLPPFRVRPDQPRRNLERFNGPHGVCRPYSGAGTEELCEPGFQPRPRPPAGFLTLLTVCSPPCLPAHGTGATHGVHPAERFPSVEPYAFRRRCPLAVSGIACSCSEDQEFTMPCSSRALLPTEVRTCLGPRPAQADALMGFLCLSRAIPTRRGPGFPGPSLLRFTRQTSGRPNDRRSRDFTDAWAGKPLAGPANSLEVFHQDLSSVSPR
jgi:hypothetical protein